MNKTGKKAEKEVIANILQECFDQNRSANYVIAQDRHRKTRMKRLMEYSYEICNAFGEVLISEDRTACALILLPHQKKDNFFSIQQDLRLITGSVGLANLPKVLRREIRIKKHHPRTPFGYLWFIGVAPAMQKRGKGTNLLQRIIQKYDQLEMPLYLETSTLTNIPWYEKHGFEIYEKMNFGYTLHLLRRTVPRKHGSTE